MNWSWPDVRRGRLLFRGRLYQGAFDTAARDLADDYLIRIKELNLLACLQSDAVLLSTTCHTRFSALLGVRMADYYSLISRAVPALEINGFEERRAIYNRARSIQSYQLGKPPFNKADRDRERSMLEDAISRVETEATTKGIATSSCSLSDRLLRPAPSSAPMQPRSWLKSVVRRLWRD